MYLALYRSYRPEIFGEILGQDHIVKILKNQIQSQTVNHAYLFCGTRGTGKTTTARILAKGVNCISENEKPCGVCEHCEAIKDGIFMDVIEIDAASNNGVDNIRELRESVKYPPITGRKKVYIIDEVHMLSTGAFNALLKTLEEPPAHVMFILATTDPQKLPPTILSRCMRLDFKRVPEILIKDGMEKICKEKGIEIDEAALRLIAINADGSMRDGLSILDQCLAPGESKVTREDVLELIGASGEEVFLEIAEMIKDGSTDLALMALDKALADGKDAKQFLRDLLAHYRNLLIVKFIKEPEDILNVSCENAERIKTQSDGISLSEINKAILEISKAMLEARWSTQPRVLVELCIVMLSEKESGLMQEVSKPAQKAKIEKQPKAEAEPKLAIAQQAEAKSAPEQKAESKSAPEQKAESKVESEQKAKSQAEPEQKSESASEQKSEPETVQTPNQEQLSEPDTEQQSVQPQGLEQQADSIVNQFEHDGLWMSLFEGDDGLTGRFNIIRTGAEIKTLTETEYIVSVSSEVIKNFIEKDKSMIEELLEKRTGVKRAIKCILGIQNDGEKSANIIDDKSIQEAEELLGIDIEVQD